MSELILFLLLLLLFCFYSTNYGCNQLDQASLLSISLNISASPPLNWSSSNSTDCCLWEGIDCDDNNGVTKVCLPFRGIKGTIPTSFMNLRHLTRLNLSHNQLSGPLPHGFFLSLSLIETLDLSYNSFSGVVPPFLKSRFIKRVLLSSNHFSGVIPSSLFEVAKNLISLNTSNNTFSGLIPDSLCHDSSRSIKILDFSNNKLSGQIPPALGKCSNLQIFRAGFNSLRGSLPDDLYRVKALRELSLPVNGLSGTIGDAIVNLTNLKVLELYDNQLSGSIPKDVGKLLKLEHLLIHNNNVTGTLPASLMNCSNLSTLNMRINNLGGDLSALNFSTLLNLRKLDLGNNMFTGSFPVSLFSCKSLTALRLADNNLTGQIPQEIHMLQSLSFLSLSRNSLTNISDAIRILMGCRSLSTVILSKNFCNCSLPDDDSLKFPDGFQNLQALALGNCKLKGQLPAWLGKLKNLKVLDLSFNQITGTIPSWLKNLPRLFYIDLSSNFFVGEFPMELAKLSALTSAWAEEEKSYFELPIFVWPNNRTTQQYNQLSNLPPAIYLRNNSLSGESPIQIGQLKLLHVLDLSDNSFTGNIPDEISNLTNLEALYLSGNRLSGEIPASVKSLHFLSSFSVANNSLRGSIPSGGQFDTFPESSYDGNPGLCGPVVQRTCEHQPRIANPINPEKASDKAILMGGIAGLVFGFIVGSSGALLFPIDWLKFLQHFRIITKVPKINRGPPMGSNCDSILHKFCAIIVDEIDNKDDNESSARREFTY